MIQKNKRVLKQGQKSSSASDKNIHTLFIGDDTGLLKQVIMRFQTRELAYNLSMDKPIKENEEQNVSD